MLIKIKYFFVLCSEEPYETEELAKLTVAIDAGACDLPNRQIEIECFICKKQYSTLHSLQTHVNQYDNTNRSYKCVLCNVLIEYKRSRKEHLRTQKHANDKINFANIDQYFEALSKIPKEKKNLPFKCEESDYCHSQFDTEKKLRDHKRKSHKSTVISCLDKSCQSFFTRHDNMYKHVRSQVINKKHDKNLLKLIPISNQDKNKNKTKSRSQPKPISLKRR